MIARLALRGALLLWCLLCALLLLARLLGPASAAPILTYTAARGGISLYDALHGLELRFTPPDWPVHEFTWAPNGQEIAFLSEDERRDLVLMRMDANGQNLRPVAGTPRNLQRPLWSPDGARIAFEVNAASGMPDLFALNLNEGRVEPIYRDFAAMVTGLDWAPDGGSAVFTAQNAQYRYQLGRVSLDTPDAEWLTPPTQNSLRPDWSPDGRFIAYHNDGEGFIRLMLLDLSSGQARRVELGEYTPGVTRTSWSPDSRALALLLAPLDQTKPTHLGVVDLSSDAVQVLPYTGWIYRLAWSPDGRFIAFVGRNGPSLDAMLYDRALGTVTTLGMTWPEGTLQWRPDPYKS